MQNRYTMMSLFDGSGGFPFAAILCGIKPIYASEVEPYPIAATRSRFPNMKHLGDISKINGAEIEPVDIITFGSPCQDLSVAGKRAGLKHEANGDDETTRSGLFMEAVRIIKEMREATNGVYPNFIIWENVPGAFSSNKGEDFRIVLEEIVKIVEPTAVMPSVPQGGWPYADSYRGDGWSLAYRVFDAQYWGVPQRRRRIYLVADFRGERAEKILFEREGLRGYFEKGRTPWQTIAADAERSTGTDDCEGIPYTLKIRSGCEGGGKGALIQENLSATLATNNDQYLFQPIAYGISSYESNAMKSANPNSGIYEADTARTIDCNGGNPACNQGGIAVVQTYDARRNGDGRTVNTITGDHENRITDYTSVVVSAGFKDLNSAKARTDAYGAEVLPFLSANNHDASVVYAVDQGGGKSAANVTENMSPTLTCTHGGEPVIALDRASFNKGKNAQYDFEITDSGINSTIVAKGPGAVAYGIGNGQADQAGLHDKIGALNCMHDQQAVMLGEQPRYIVRRLTPTECARLQGFPDTWGHIEPKVSLTDEEYRFWLEVRNTHAAINGKAVKDYTPKQMLTWYNKLWTDSAEYKMWGNGIALPNALYVMQGIADALG